MTYNVSTGTLNHTSTTRHRWKEEIRFAGHVLQTAPERPAHSAIDWIQVDGRKRRDRPRKTWQSTFCDDLHARGVRWSEAEKLAADRVHWRNMLPIVLRRDWGN